MNTQQTTQAHSDIELQSLMAEEADYFDGMTDCKQMRSAEMHRGEAYLDGYAHEYAHQESIGNLQGYMMLHS